MKESDQFSNDEEEENVIESCKSLSPDKKQ
jgi:hypothetical protein